MGTKVFWAEEDPPFAELIGHSEQVEEFWCDPCYPSLGPPTSHCALLHATAPCSDPQAFVVLKRAEDPAVVDPEDNMLATPVRIAVAP